MKAKILFMASCLMMTLSMSAQEVVSVTKEQQTINGKTVSIYRTVRDGETKIDSVYIDKAAKDNKHSLVVVQNNGETIVTELAQEAPVLNCDVMPEFPGGTAAMMAFLFDNLHYPEDAKDAGKEGRILCSLVITDTGKVTNVHVVKSCGTQSLDDEAVRVINLMPDWTPGTQDGKPVSVQYTIPIMFALK